MLGKNEDDSKSVSESEDDDGENYKTEGNLGAATILFHMESEVKRKLKEDEKSSSESGLENKKSRFELQKEGELIPRPFVKAHKGIGEAAGYYLSTDSATIKSQLISHLEHTLGKSLANISKQSLYHATVLCARDRLIETLNDTDNFLHSKDAKTLYYVSLQPTIAISLKTTLINLDIENMCTEFFAELGYTAEEIYECGASNNGSLETIMEALTTANYPAKAYGIRYDSPLTFSCEISPEGKIQTVNVDKVLHKNQWEIEKSEQVIPVGFGGKAEKANWIAEEVVAAVPHDMPIAGYNTFHTNSIRRFTPFLTHKGMEVKDLKCKRYENAVTPKEKELKLKQDYFIAAAAVCDIVKNYRNSYNDGFKGFYDKVTIHLSDTNAALTIIELFRVLLDEYQLSYDEAFNIVKKTFTYESNSSVEKKYEVPLVQKILPRHLDLIYLLNYHFLESVRLLYPANLEIMRKLSWIEEAEPKKVRLENICMTICYSWRFCGKIKNELVHEFIGYFQKAESVNYKDKLIEVYMGESQRKWVLEANPGLSSMFTRYIGSERWIKDFSALRGLEAFTHDESLAKEYASIKKRNKCVLAGYIQQKTGIVLNTESMLDITLLEIKEHKRLILSILYLFYRYHCIKTDHTKTIPRTVLFGITKPVTTENGKKLINLLCQLSGIINKDPVVRDLLQIVLIPQCNDTVMQKIIPAADLSQYLSSPNTEAFDPSIIQCAMNGCLILGANHGPVLELAQEVGKGNLALFGSTPAELEEFKKLKKEVSLGAKLKTTLTEIRKLDSYPELKAILAEGDYYGVPLDFDSYVAAQDLVDECYANKDEWIAKAILIIARCGRFSADRMVRDLVHRAWQF
eukprot:TRINITY_DN1250_c0_g1_i1.p2 TRINITY_DN1250_c0_g1~~TRINITY_DN1250_c0_g1_i1.p2  ORF type:complete len:857 (-),score=94.47 TRINITY_DN1250_c0_g1_i1:3634-6204(-)